MGAPAVGSAGNFGIERVVESSIAAMSVAANFVRAVPLRLPFDLQELPP